MTKEHKSNKYKGIFWRELADKDRSYYIRVRLNGKVTRVHVGKKSEGITEAFCNQEKIRLINESKFGVSKTNKLRKVKDIDPTFKELLEWYIDKKELKESTIKHLASLKNIPFYNSKKITRAELQDYIDDLSKKHRPATVTLKYRQLRAVFRYAIQREKYKYADPTEGIDLPKSTGARQRYFTPEEIARLLDALRDKPRLYLFVKLSICTGARMRTILTIKREHIKESGEVLLYNHKAERWYTGFIDAETLELVKDKKGYVLALKGKEQKEPAHQSIQYPIQEKINELFNPPGTPADKRAVLHTLRHSVATQQVRKGVPIEIISKTLDHSSPITTAQIYAKVAPEVIKNAVKDLWE